MRALELIVMLGAVVLAVSVLGPRLRIAAPILLLIVGVGVGFVPLFQITLDPAVMLLLFLPALLYWESLTTSLREIRTNIRGILLTSTLLVVLSAAVVATVLHALGMGWGPAWVLGAAVAPTDATATAAFAGSLPRRTATALRAESLVNDGTTLVVYGLAVDATVADMPPTGWTISGTVLLSYLAGIGIGLACAAVAILIRRHIDSALQENIATLLTPFTAYLAAEFAGGSGVLAVVACGLTLSQIGPKIGRADTRQQTRAFWTLAVTLLNGALFVLVGIELHPATRGLGPGQLALGLLAVVIVFLLLVAVRAGFLFGFAALIRLIDRRPNALALDTGSRAVQVVAGFRGAVSLAAALAVPTTIDGGGAFPDRDFIIFVTAGVIALTLIVQGLLLPIVVRRARLPSDSAVDREIRIAEIDAGRDALAALPRLAADLGTDRDVAERTRDEYQRRLDAAESDADADARRRHGDYIALHTALVRRMRQTVIALRDRGEIDDIAMREVQARLDAEEVSLQVRAEATPPEEP